MNGLGSVVFEFLVKPWTQGTGVIKWILNSDTWRKDRPSLSPNWTRLVLSRCINWWLNMDTYSLRGGRGTTCISSDIYHHKVNEYHVQIPINQMKYWSDFLIQSNKHGLLQDFNESLSQYLYNLWINCVTAFAFECQYKFGFNLLLNSKYISILRYIHSHLNMSIFLFYGTIFFSVFKSDDRQYARGCLWT